MIGLVVSLAILVGMGFWLKAIIAATIATRTYNRALENFEDGDYRTSIRDFDAFLESNPEDPRCGQGSSPAGVRQRPAIRLAGWGDMVVRSRGGDGDDGACRR